MLASAATTPLGLNDIAGHKCIAAVNSHGRWLFGSRHCTVHQNIQFTMCLQHVFASAYIALYHSTVDWCRSDLKGPAGLYAVVQRRLAVSLMHNNLLPWPTALLACCAAGVYSVGPATPKQVLSCAEMAKQRHKELTEQLEAAATRMES